jgi:hypothetical protein
MFGVGITEALVIGGVVLVFGGGMFKKARKALLGADHTLIKAEETVSPRKRMREMFSEMFKAKKEIDLAVKDIADTKEKAAKLLG